MEIQIKSKGAMLCAIIDDSDAWVIDKYAFEISKGKYVRVRKRGDYYGGRWSLHRVLLGVEDKKDVDVDHKNGNTLDNRREHLRACTRGQNNVNRVARGRSKYKGVLFCRIPNGRGGFYEYIKVRMGSKGKVINMGPFASEFDAAMAYDERAKELHGEFARLNFPS